MQIRAVREERTELGPDPETACIAHPTVLKAIIRTLGCASVRLMGLLNPKTLSRCLG